MNLARSTQSAGSVSVQPYSQTQYTAGDDNNLLIVRSKLKKHIKQEEKSFEAAARREIVHTCMKKTNIVLRN